jgi:fructokinase
MDKSNKILCFGEVLWDMLPSGAKPGGAPMNVALHLKKAGFTVDLVSKIGNDSKGQELADFLSGSGLKLDFIQIDNQLATSVVLVSLDENNNASYSIVENVAWDNIEYTPELESLANQADVIVFGTLAARSVKTKETLLKVLSTKATKVIDVNLRPPFNTREIVELLLQKADIAKLNDEELAVISAWHNQTGTEQERMEWLALQYKLTEVIVTKGSEGAVVWNQANFYVHKGFKIQVADSVGAGDAFLAGYLSGWAQHLPTDKTLALACATGAYVATQHGPTPDYNRSSINEILSQNTNY